MVDVFAETARGFLEPAINSAMSLAESFRTEDRTTSRDVRQRQRDFFNEARDGAEDAMLNLAVAGRILNDRCR